MAKKKISGLPAGSALNGTELVPIVQAGTTKRTTTQDIANLGNASGVEGSGTINTLPKFTASSTIGNSAFFDDGTNQGTETTTAVNRFIMSANASIAKIFSFRSGNLPRWAFRVDGTESGANAGADLAIRRYDDAGTFIDSPLFIKRSTGNIGLGTTSPSVLLQLGEGSLSNSTVNQYLRINSGGYNALSYAHLDLFNFGNNFSNPLGWRITSGTDGVGVSIGRFLSFNSVVTDGSGNPSTATERGRFSSGGNFLIGTTTDAGYKLDVNGTARFFGNTRIENAAAGTALLQLANNDSSPNNNNWSIIVGFGGARQFQVRDNLAGERFTINGDGKATFAGSIAINNTISAGIAVASTHKVAIEIGGVTYYLLASNV
jgi:hypothetical protein